MSKINLNFIPTFCACFCSGIILAAYSKIPLIIFYICAFTMLACAIIFISRDLRFSICICLLAVFLGAALFKNYQILPLCHIAKITPYKSIETTLRGIIISDPVISKNRTTFILAAKEISSADKIKTCGKAQVTFFGSNRFSYGQELILSGKLYRPMNFNKSARFNYRDYLKQQGIYSLFSAKKAWYLRKNQANPIVALAFWLKHKTQTILRRHISGAPLAILEAMTLGERKGIPAY
ncbi:MAG: DUF4131 domain-containing protein, partial [Candidatus Omnitrophica bacterium]|nr:DUF4131 domain-containing protein [Candidatus Omnitrophota bacterium]